MLCNDVVAVRCTTAHSECSVGGWPFCVNCAAVYQISRNRATCEPQRCVSAQCDNGQLFVSGSNWTVDSLPPLRSTNQPAPNDHSAPQHSSSSERCTRTSPHTAFGSRNDGSSIARQQPPHYVSAIQPAANQSHEAALPHVPHCTRTAETHKYALRVVTAHSTQLTHGHTHTR